MVKAGYSTVTELPDEEVPKEQLERITERYYWASKYSVNKDVLECACGAGQGSKMLNLLSHSYVAGDYDGRIVDIAQRGHGGEIEFHVFDACNIPFDNSSFDVVLICEAIYYIPNIQNFLNEAWRVLKPGGRVLIVTANSSLFDFNQSPFTYIYPDVLTMSKLFSEYKFNFISAEGGTNISDTNVRQKILRPLKLIATKLNLIPKTMSGKAWLKKMFFGGDIVTMPKSIDSKLVNVRAPKKISKNKNDKNHKVLYFVGEKIS
jgi:ubiquinone/menaquinone biosynthesis C-methylase UbiE